MLVCTLAKCNMRETPRCVLMPTIGGDPKKSIETNGAGSRVFVRDQFETEAIMFLLRLWE